jgi:DNA-binding transcriptional ArsR family regulator
MDKFYALSAPIRREIIALLSEGEKLTATAIAEKFQISAPAISQHLKVLLNSDLVKMHKQAQQRIYELNPIKILELESWANQITTQLEKVSITIEKQIDPTKREATS